MRSAVKVSQIKKGGKNGVCGTLREERNAYGILLGKRDEVRSHGGLGLHGKMLKWVLKKQDRKMNTGFLCPRIWSNDGLL